MRATVVILFSWLILANVPTPLSAEENAPEITVKSEADRAFVTIGDRIQFRLTVKHRPDIEVLSIDAGPALADFEVKGTDDFSSREEGWVVGGTQYTLVNYELGEYVIRPAKIQYRSMAGGVQVIESNPLYISVESIDQAERPPGTDIRGLKGVVDLKGLPWLWLALAAGAIGTGAFLFWRILSRKKGVGRRAAPILLSPHEEAYQALSQLRHSDLLRTGKTKLYFMKMSEIIRHYLERRFGIRAMELTTYELMKEMKTACALEERQLVQEVLEYCDLVKFAKYMPQPTEILSQNKHAKNVIDRTKEQQIEIESSSGANVSQVAQS